MHHEVHRQRVHRRSHKRKSQHAQLKNVRVPDHLKSTLLWSLEAMTNKIIVFDGGAGATLPIQPPAGVQWESLRISAREMWVPDTKNADVGLIYRESPASMPSFIRLPRNKSLSMTGMRNDESRELLMSALMSALDAQKSSSPRGDERRVFIEEGGKYCGCLGAQTCRAKKGIRPETYHKRRMTKEHWDMIVRYVRSGEACFRRFLDTMTVQHISAASGLFEYFRMVSGCGDELTENEIFQGIGFGTKVFLACHTDWDFTYSISSPHIKGGAYTNDGDILLYFCFPRIGIAVPLRAGDMILFNPKEPHAVSSRLRKEDDVVVLSLYLKTAIVGGNDNDAILTPDQSSMAERFSRLGVLDK